MDLGGTQCSPLQLAWVEPGHQHFKSAPWRLWLQLRLRITVPGESLLVARNSSLKQNPWIVEFFLHLKSVGSLWGKGYCQQNNVKSFWHQRRQPWGDFVTRSHSPTWEDGALIHTLGCPSRVLTTLEESILWGQSASFTPLLDFLSLVSWIDLPPRKGAPCEGSWSQFLGQEYRRTLHNPTVELWKGMPAACENT